MKSKLLWAFVPAAAAAAGLGFVLMKRKDSPAASGGKAETSPSRGKAAGRSAAKSAPATDPASLKESSYSFISGFRDAATVEVRCTYDSSRFTYAVLEDDFPAESGDSHVAVLSGEDFSMQLEYGSYYTGEDFARLKAELAARHPGFRESAYGENTCLLYQNGDNLCLDFPIAGDSSSFLHVTLMKEKGNDDPLDALPDYEDVKTILSSLSFTRT